MSKTRIDSGSVLADIRAGMSDESLMKKYRLTNLGLQSLFVKLAKMGLLKYVRAGQAIADIRAGMNDEALMKKHRLSQSGLCQLFQQLDELGLLGIEELRSIAVSDADVIASEALRATDVGPDPALSEEEEELAQARLESIIANILRGDSVDGDQLPTDNPYCGASGSDNMRACPRFTFGAPISVCFRDNRTQRGFLRDVTEQGLGIRHLESTAGELKDLILLGDEFGEVPPFECRVQCKWARWDERLGCHAGGFLIVDMPEENRYYFQQLIRLTEHGPAEGPEA